MILEDKADLKRRFEAAFQLMHRREFLENKLLGGGIPFFIMDYPIELDGEMQKEIAAFKRRLTAEGIRVLEVDLYDLCMLVIEEYSSIEKMKRLEDRRRGDRFIKAIQSTLDVRDRITPKIKREVEAFEPQIILISGIAHIFPFLRANEILNHLNTELSDIPTLIFYPGTYHNKQLTLFDRIEDSKYYRAYPINELKIAQR